MKLPSTVGSPVDGLGLPGEFAGTPQARGLVVLVHAGGGGRSSLRSRLVAHALHEQGMATLQLDLLGEQEAADPHAVLELPLLTRRVVAVLDRLHRWEPRGPIEQLGARPVGLFAAGSGAAASLGAAVARPGRACAVVSRSGRVEQVAPATLAQVRAPTLLIVGAADVETLRFNREALRTLRCEKRLETVPGATRCFDEPGALDAAAQLAAQWFGAHCNLPAGP